MKPSWSQANSVVQRLILKAALFIIYVSDLDDETERSFSEFLDNAKLGQVVAKADGWAASQSWTGWRNALTATSCKVVRLGQHNKSVVGIDWLESSSTEKALGS